MIDRVSPGGPKLRSSVPVARSIPHPPPNTQNINVEGANALLDADDVILALKFFHQNAIENAEVWSVLSINEKRTLKGHRKEYAVVFAHDNEQCYEMIRDELVELLSESIVYET